MEQNQELASLDSARKYLSIIVKNKGVFILVVIFITTLAVIVSYILPKKYEAKSTVFIERNVISSLVKDIAVTPSMDDRLRVLLYSMKSRRLLGKVIKELDVSLSMKKQAVLIADLQKKTSIEIRKGSRGMDLFIISYRDKDPEFARDYVNTLVNVYIEGNLSEKRNEAYGANTFLSEQIEFFKQKLDAVDAEILNFRREKGIFVSTDERAIVSEIRDTEESLELVKIAQKEIEAKIDSMKVQLEGRNAHVTGELEESADMRALHKKLSILLLNYTENYPEVVKVRSEIEALRQRYTSMTEMSDAAEDLSTEMSGLNPFIQELKADLVKVESEHAAMIARENYLKQLIESKKAYLRDVPAEKKKLADMERQRATDEQIYGELILRHGQSEVSKQMEIQDKGATFNIIDPAVLPFEPVSPNRVLIMLGGFFAGLAVAFGVVFLIDNIDTSIKSTDVLKKLGLPVLAVIPTVRDAKDLSVQRRKDIMIYSFAGIYIVLFMMLLAMELLKITFLDQLVTKLIM